MYPTLTRAAVHHHAHQLLQSCLRVPDFSPRCSARALLLVLLAACARVCSLSCACWSLATAPSRETLRRHLLGWLPAQAELLRRLNRALADDIPRALRRRRQRVACDLTLIPYHGQPMLDLREVYRAQAKDGTTHFHAYATAYVNHRGQRLTLALAAVERGERLEDVLRRLLSRLSELGIRTGLLLLDRGFWSVGVIRYLQAARRPFLMPVAMRGRRADHPKGPGGTRVFATRKQGGWDTYTLTAADGRTARVSICVCCRNYDGQWGRHGRQALVYGFWGITPSSPAWVRQTYRQRFAIETTYRQLHQCRARTCTRNPVVRLLLVGVALVLRNVWVWLHWEVLSTPRRGGRRLNLDRLTLETMLLWLQHQAERELGWCDEVHAERPIPQGVTG